MENNEFQWGPEFQEVSSPVVGTQDVDNIEDDSYSTQIVKGLEHAGSYLGDLGNAAKAGLYQAANVSAPVSRYHQQRTREGIKDTLKLGEGLTTTGQVTSMAATIAPLMATMAVPGMNLATTAAVGGGLTYADVVRDQLEKGINGPDGLQPIDQVAASTAAGTSAFMNAGLSKAVAPLMAKAPMAGRALIGGGEGTVSGVGDNTIFNAATDRELGENAGIAALGGGVTGAGMTSAFEGANKLLGSRHSQQAADSIEQVYKTNQKLGTGDNPEFENKVYNHVKLQEELDLRASEIKNDPTLGAKEQEAALAENARQRSKLTESTESDSLSTQIVNEYMADVGVTNRWQNAEDATGNRFGDTNNVSKKDADKSGNIVTNASESDFITIGNKEYTRDKYYDSAQKELKKATGEMEGAIIDRHDKVRVLYKNSKQDGTPAAKVQAHQDLADDLSELVTLTERYSASKGKDLLRTIQRRSDSAIRLARELGITEQLRGAKGRAFDPVTEAKVIRGLYNAGEAEIPGFRDSNKTTEASQKKSKFDMTDAMSIGAFGVTGGGSLALNAGRRALKGYSSLAGRGKLKKELAKGAKVGTKSQDLAKLTNSLDIRDSLLNKRDIEATNAEDAALAQEGIHTTLGELEVGDPANTPINGSSPLESVTEAVRATPEVVPASPEVTPANPLPVDKIQADVVPEVAPVVPKEAPSAPVEPAKNPRTVAEEKVKAAQSKADKDKVLVDQIEQEVVELKETSNKLPPKSPERVAIEEDIAHVVDNVLTPAQAVSDKSQAAFEEAKVELKTTPLPTKEVKPKAKKEENKKTEEPSPKTEEAPVTKEKTTIPTKKPKAKKKEAPVEDKPKNMIPARERDLHEMRTFDNQVKRMANSKNLRKLSKDADERNKLVKDAQDELLSEGLSHREITDQEVEAHILSKQVVKKKEKVKVAEKRVEEIITDAPAKTTPNELAIKDLKEWSTDRNIPKDIQEAALEALGMTSKDLKPGNIAKVRNKQRDLLQAATEAVETPKRIQETNEEYGIPDDVYEAAIKNLDIKEGKMKDADYKRVLNEQYSIIKARQKVIDKKTKSDLDAKNASRKALLKKENQARDIAEKSETVYQDERAILDKALWEQKHVPATERINAPKDLAVIIKRVDTLKKNASNKAEKAAELKVQREADEAAIKVFEKDIAETEALMAKQDAISKVQSQVADQATELRAALEKRDPTGAYVDIIDDIMDSKFTNRTKPHGPSLYESAKTKLEAGIKKQKVLDSKDAETDAAKVTKAAKDMDEAEITVVLESISKHLGDMVKQGDAKGVERAIAMKEAATKASKGKVDEDVSKGQEVIDKLFKESYENKVKYPDNEELWIPGESMQEIRDAIGSGKDSNHAGPHHKRLRLLINGKDDLITMKSRDEISKSQKDIDDKIKKEVEGRELLKSIDGSSLTLVPKTKKPKKPSNDDPDPTKPGGKKKVAKKKKPTEASSKTTVTKSKETPTAALTGAMAGDKAPEVVSAELPSMRPEEAPTAPVAPKTRAEELRQSAKDDPDFFNKSLSGKVKAFGKNSSHDLPTNPETFNYEKVGDTYVPSSGGQKVMGDGREMPVIRKRSDYKKHTGGGDPKEFGLGKEDKYYVEDKDEIFTSSTLKGIKEKLSEHIAHQNKLHNDEMNKPLKSSSTKKTDEAKVEEKSTPTKVSEPKGALSVDDATPSLTGKPYGTKVSKLRAKWAEERAARTPEQVKADEDAMRAESEKAAKAKASKDRANVKRKAVRQGKTAYDKARKEVYREVYGEPLPVKTEKAGSSFWRVKDHPLAINIYKQNKGDMEYDWDTHAGSDQHGDVVYKGSSLEDVKRVIREAEQVSRDDTLENAEKVIKLQDEKWEEVSGITRKSSSGIGALSGANE